MAEAEQTTLMKECFAYDDELRKGGHRGKRSKHPHDAAVSERKVTVTDGPYAETKSSLADS